MPSGPHASVGELDSDLEGGLLVGRDFLNDPRSVSRQRVPVLSGEHIAHSISPTGLAGKADGCAAVGKTAVRVLVLTVTDTGTGNADTPTSRPGARKPRIETGVGFDAKYSHGRNG
jgi:hypothetical protein